jgi:hypothetical protein
MKSMKSAETLKNDSVLGSIYEYVQGYWAYPIAGFEQHFSRGRLEEYSYQVEETAVPFDYAPEYGATDTDTIKTNNIEFGRPDLDFSTLEFDLEV